LRNNLRAAEEVEEVEVVEVQVLDQLLVVHQEREGGQQEQQ
jgi:hypothetical protein